MNNMTIPQTIFTIFYALYFPVVIPMFRVFQPFDTPRMYGFICIQIKKLLFNGNPHKVTRDLEKSWLRFVCSFLLIDVLPAIYFSIIFIILGKNNSFPDDCWGIIIVLLGIFFLSLSGFGFYRIYFGIMLIKHKSEYWFYGYESDLPYGLEKELENRKSNFHKDWKAHVIPGVLWIVILTILGLIMIISQTCVLLFNQRNYCI